MRINSKAEKLLKRISKPITENVVWFVSTYTLLAFCTMLFPWNGSRIIGVLQLYVELYIVAVVITLLPSRIADVTRWLLTILFYIICLLDTFCYCRLNIPITPTLLALFMQTNNKEAQEAIVAYTSDFEALTPIIGIVTIFIANIVLLFLNRKIKNIATKYTTLIALSSILLLVIIVPICIKNEIYLFHRLVLGDDEKQTYIKSSISPTVRFYTPIHRLANAFIEYNREKDVIEFLHSSIEKAAVEDCSFTSSRIVLKIGESYNRHHSQIYGYSMPTTPRQVGHINSGELIPFCDAISQWNLTSESFRSMLSTHTEGDSGRWYNYPLVTTLFKNAGYTTLFLSNQFVTEESETYSDFEENILLNESRMSQAQFTLRNRHRHQYDEELIDDYNEMELPQNSKGEFIIFHLMGQHVDFEERYPLEWKKFTPSMYSCDHPEIVAHYDNATLYNDYILDTIIKKFVETDAIIIHMPDHGERVSDDGEGYGRRFSFTRGDIQQQYEIPFWIYTTAKYRKNHPEIVEQIDNAKRAPITTDNLAHMLLYLGGIKTPFYNCTKNPLVKSFNPNVPRIIGGTTDYDKAMESHNLK